MLIKDCHLEKSCYFKDRANQGLVNQGLTVLHIAIFNRFLTSIAIAIAIVLSTIANALFGTIEYNQCQITNNQCK